MHLLERRVRTRRESDRLPGPPPSEASSGRNRRIADRRACALRRAMTLKRLHGLRLDGVHLLKIECASYVLNGNCFAWLAEVQLGMSRRFVAGSGRLPEDCQDEAGCVVAAIHGRLLDWEDVLLRR